MSVDVKEWSERLYGEVPWEEQRRFTEGLIDLIRAVLADQQSQQPPAAAEPAAEPECPIGWEMKVAERIRSSLGATSGVLAQMIHMASKAELAARVESATADLRKQLADPLEGNDEIDRLRAELAEARKNLQASGWQDEVDRLRAELRTTMLDKCKRIGDMEQQLADRDVEIAELRAASFLHRQTVADNCELAAEVARLTAESERYAAIVNWAHAEYPLGCRWDFKAMCNAYDSIHQTAINGEQDAHDRKST